MSATILIIDDDPASLDFMKYLLGSFGHIIVTAADGEEGLNAASAQHFDLIISDVAIPKLDGCELAAQLKADPALRDVPLLAVTASAMPADRQRMLSAGFNSYITKPIVPETFLEQIEDLLPPETRSGGQQPEAQPPIAKSPAAKSSPAANTKGKFIKELADAFVRNVPTLLAGIRSAREQGDYKALRAAAHKMLGSCIFIKEPELIASLRRLEKTIDEKNFQRIESLLQEVERLATQVGARLQCSVSPAA